MIITKENYAVINTKDIDLHDAIFDGVRFEQSEKRLTVCLRRPDNKQPFEVQFCGVAGYRLTSMDFWGYDPYVFQFNALPPKEWTLLPTLQAQMVEPIAVASLFETEFLMCSGDTLTIVCNKIIIADENCVVFFL